MLRQPARFYGHPFVIELRRTATRPGFWARLRGVKPIPGVVIARLHILPCDMCGTPMFPGALHNCFRLADDLMEWELGILLGEDVEAEDVGD